MKLNTADSYESIKVRLSQSDHPIAFQNKVDELVESGLSKNEAFNYVDNTPIELELYYQKHGGLFAVESEAVESGTIYNPYSGELCDNSKID